MDCTHSKEALLLRLKKIEGQVKGLQRMVGEEQGCMELLVQVAAVRAAVNRVGTLIIMNYSRKCLERASMTEDQEKAMEELIDVLGKFTK